MHFRSQKKLQGEVSLSESIESDRDGNSLQLMDVIGVDDTMLEDLYDRDSALRLRQLVYQCLTRREAEVIRLRYGLGGTIPLTQREIASTFGISRSYVSRIEKRALEKLRAELEKPVGGAKKRCLRRKAGDIFLTAIQMPGRKGFLTPVFQSKRMCHPLRCGAYRRRAFCRRPRSPYSTWPPPG